MLYKLNPNLNNHELDLPLTETQQLIPLPELDHVSTLFEGIDYRYYLATKTLSEKEFRGQYAIKSGSKKALGFKNTPLLKLVAYYMKQGKQTQAQSFVLEAFQEIYTIILKNPNLDTFNILGGYSPLAGELLQSWKFYNPHNVLHWCAWKSRQTFMFKCFNTPKRYRRLLKTKYQIKLVSIHSDARVMMVLRHLHFFTEEQDSRAFAIRIFLSLTNALFKYKQGLFQKRRVRTYQLALLRARNQGYKLSK